MGHLTKHIATVMVFVAAAAFGDGDAFAQQRVAVRLTFLDSEVFDNQLSDALRRSTDGVTEIATPTPLKLDNIPPRLNAWLAAVQQQQGVVTVRPKRTGDNGKDEQFVQLLKPVALSIVSAFVASFLPGKSEIAAVRDYLRDSKLYAPARGHHLTIYYDDNNGQISSLEFRRVD